MDIPGICSNSNLLSNPIDRIGLVVGVPREEGEELDETIWKRHFVLLRSRIRRPGRLGSWNDVADQVGHGSGTTEEERCSEGYGLIFITSRKPLGVSTGVGGGKWFRVPV